MANSPKAEIQITAESRTLGAKLREARAQFAKFGGALKKEVFGKVLFDGPKASAHMVGQLGAQAVGKGVGFLEDQARGVLEFNEALTNFQIATRKTPEEAQEVGMAARQIAADVGLASEKVLAGEQAWVDLAGAENGTVASMRTLARAARAGNTEITDMATVMYSLSNAMHINPGEMENALGGLINQSKDGTVHFKNMAEEIIAVAPKFARFGVTGRQGAVELGAMFQVVRSGFKDSAETATGLEGIFKGLIRNAPRFKAAGVNVFNVGKDGVKHLKPIQEIFAQIEKSKLIKDPSKLIKAFGRGEGEAAFRLLVEQASKFNELVKSGLVDGTIQEDLATKTESAGGRIAIAMERVKNGVAEAMTPERIDKFVAALEDAPETIEGVAKSVGLLTDSMAALYNVGKTVRGWISGNTNQNPWVASMSDPGSMFQSQVDAAVLAEGDESTPEARGRLTAARLRKANREAYDQTVDDIQGAAKADQTERAVLAKYAPSTLPGGIGRNVAGEKYLENAGVTEAQTREVLAKAIRDAIGPVAAKVIEALAKPPPVQIDGQAASKHLANSRHHTTRTGG